MTSLLRLIAVTLLTISPAALTSLPAAAAPLDKEACNNLEREQKKLLTKEVQEALTRGPDWVKAHLDPEKIERVRQYLTVEESVMFRCRGGIKIVLPPPPPLPDRKPVIKATAETKPSQALADSDKTATSAAIKATP